VFNHLTRLADGMGIRLDPRVEQAAEGDPLRRAGAVPPP
jgi:hypothetical protein